MAQTPYNNDTPPTRGRRGIVVGIESGNIGISLSLVFQLPGSLFLSTGDGGHERLLLVQSPQGSRSDSEK